MQRPLFDDADDRGKLVSSVIRVNRDYATKFNAAKDKEELQRLSTKAASGALSLNRDDDDSTSDSEDSDAELLTRDVDARVLETIALLRGRDPCVYDPSVKFFDSDEEGEEIHSEDRQARRQKLSRTTYGAVLSKTLLEEGADAFVKEDEIFENAMAESRLDTNRYEAEQQSLKRAFWEAADTANDGDEALTAASGTNDGGVLQIVARTASERQAEEQSFKQFLKQRSLTSAEGKGNLIERYFRDDNYLDDKERFLRDYVLSEQWKEDPRNRLSESTARSHDGDGTVDDEDDNKNLEDTDAFEAAYNFRFEEENSGVIQGHARVVLDSVRRKDDRRRRKRLERLAKKEVLKKAKLEELKRLKALKRQELINRLQTIQKVAGLSRDIALSMDELEADYDEERHEEIMQKIVGPDYEDRASEEKEDEAEAAWLEVVALDPSLRPEMEVAVVNPLSKRQAKLMARKAARQNRKNVEQDTGEAYAPMTVEDEAEAETSVGSGFPDSGLIGSDPVDPVPSSTKNRQENLVLVNEAGETLWFRCDGCNFGIPVGRKRFDCFHCEDNFTLCVRCYRDVRHPHRLVQRRVPIGCDPPVGYLRPSNNVQDGKGKYSDKDRDLKAEGAKRDTVQNMIQSVINEFDELDYDDLVGDIPMRYGYIEIEPHDYRLTPEQLLKSSEKQLNKIIPGRRLLTPYRSLAKHDRKKRQRPRK